VLLSEDYENEEGVLNPLSLSEDTLWNEKVFWK